MPHMEISHFQHTQIRLNGAAWRLGRVSVIFTPTLFISFSFVYTTSEKSFPSVLENRKQNIENCFNLGGCCCWSCAAVGQHVDVMEKECQHREGIAFAPSSTSTVYAHDGRSHFLSRSPHETRRVHNLKWQLRRN